MLFKFCYCPCCLTSQLFVTLTGYVQVEVLYLNNCCFVTEMCLHPANWSFKALVGIFAFCSVEMDSKPVVVSKHETVPTCHQWHCQRQPGDRYCKWILRWRSYCVKALIMQRLCVATDFPWSQMVVQSLMVSCKFHHVFPTAHVSYMIFQCTSLPLCQAYVPNS